MHVWRHTASCIWSPGACIGNRSGTNLHIKLDIYNTAYESCDTWTLYIFFSTLKLNSPGILYTIVLIEYNQADISMYIHVYEHMHTHVCMYVCTHNDTDSHAHTMTRIHMHTQ